MDEIKRYRLLIGGVVLIAMGGLAWWGFHERTGRADCFGRTVNVAARVADAGHGGQVLLSGAAWSQVAASSSTSRRGWASGRWSSRPSSSG